ncbi:MAG: ribonuclease P protein component 1 [Candidatus Aenigmatarchaeota archaeon]|nr:MAG: ribonuclease P protein component 1 [Candidatus Aenigmarchaeota archaeon]
MITPENIVRHELIGLKAKVTSSTDQDNVGAEGRVVDESRNMLVIETKLGEKNFVKEQNIFSFYLPRSRKWVSVDGKIIVARPEDRIKKKFDKW